MKSILLGLTISSLLSVPAFASTCASPQGNRCGAICLPNESMNADDPNRFVIRADLEFVSFEDGKKVDSGNCRGEIAGASILIDNATCTGKKFSLKTGTNSEENANLTQAVLTNLTTGETQKVFCANINGIQLSDFNNN